MLDSYEFYRSAANFIEIVKGFGILPNKEIEDFAHRYHCALIAKYDLSSMVKMRSGYRGAQLATDVFIIEALLEISFLNEVAQSKLVSLLIFKL